MTGPNRQVADAIFHAVSPMVANDPNSAQIGGYLAAVMVVVQRQADALDALVERVSRLDGDTAPGIDPVELRLIKLELADAYRGFAR